MTAVPHFDLRLLGSFQLSRTSGEVITMRRKTRALLAYLAVTKRPQTRRALMDLFCQNTQSPARALSLLLTRIRQNLDAAVLITDSETVQLDAKSIRVDFIVFQQQFSGDLAQKNSAALETAVSLYHGEFLEGLSLRDAPEFELWLLGQRARCRQLIERGLLVLVQRFSQDGTYEAAISHAQQLLQYNPLLEEAHAQLIWLYAQTGQRAAALRQYDQCRDLLQSELGVAPTTELRQLQTAVLSGKLPQPLPHPAKTAVLPATPSSPTDFVGRAAELAQLRAAWQTARQGSGAALLIGAPAGGGKTRLVQTVVQTLPATAVYTSRCYESTRTLPYQPWLEILEAHAAQLEDSALNKLPPATQAYLSRLLPDLERRVSSTLATSASVIEEPERLFTAVVDFLAHPATGSLTPRLLVMDDLQWADEASLRLLHYVSQRVTRFPWLLIGMYRSEEMAENPPLVTLLDDFARRNIVTLNLAPLQAAAVLELTAHSWPRLAADQRSHLADRLIRATGGNALFVTAVLQELTAAEAVPTELPVPDSVQDLLQRRLRRLPQGQRQVLEALAVWGGPASLAQVQHISARGEEETTEALEWGLQWGLITVETAVSPLTYQFQHDLVREAVYATLSAVRRQRLHHRTAHWLAHVAKRQPGVAQHEMAARVLYHARLGEAFPLVFQWADIAATHARLTFAYGDAVHALDTMRQAFDHLQLLPDFAVETAEPVLFEQLLWWLTYSWVLGKSETEVQAVLSQAQQIFARHPSSLREAQLRFVETKMTLGYAEAIPAFTELHNQLLRLEEPELAAAALAEAASGAITISQNKNGRSLYEQALALYRLADDKAGEIRCLSGLGWTAINLGEINLAQHYAQEALSISHAQGDPLGEAQALYTLAMTWIFYHVPDEIAAAATASQQLYTRVGFQRQAIRPLLSVGAAHDMRANWAVALAVYEEVLAQATAYEDAWLAGWAAQLAGRIYLRQGRLDVAEARLKQAQQLRLTFDERQNQVSDLAWLGRLALAQGDPNAALEQTRQAITQLDAFQGEFYVWEQPDVLMCHAEALAAVGQMAEALAAAARAWQTVCRFAEQIDDPVIRAQFMAYRNNARVQTAVTQQHISPWPDS